MASSNCPQCERLLARPYACEHCNWRAPPAHTFELTPRDPKRGKEVRDMTPEERAENRRLCQPIIDRIKAQLKASELKHRGSAMPHVLAGISYDPEAVAEREAIQREWEDSIRAAR